MSGQDDIMEFQRESQLDFGGSGFSMDKTVRVTINENNGQVEGWDQIWAILDGEDKIKHDNNRTKNQKLEELKQSGVTDYIQEIRTSNNDPIPKGKINIAELQAAEQYQ